MAFDLYHDSIMNTFLQVKTSDIKNQQKKKPKKQKKTKQTKQNTKKNKKLPKNKNKLKKRATL